VRLSPVSRGVVTGTFLMMAGEGAINPVLPLFGAALGGSVAIVGVLIAASGLSRMLFNFPAGRMADVVGRRPLLVFGPLITLVTALLATGAEEVWQLVALRLMSGSGTGAFMTGSIIVLSDIDDEAERLRSIGAYRAAIIIGVLIGPIVGGAVAEVAGFRAAFGVQVLVAAGASLWSFLRLPRSGPPARADGSGRPPPWTAEIRALMANRDLVLVSLVTFTIFFTLTGARQAIIPLLGDERLGLSAGGLGVLFGLISLANLLSIWPASQFGRSHGPKPVIVVSGLVTAASLIAFALTHDMTMFLVGGILMGVGSGLASPTTASYAAGVAPSESRGSAMGLYQAVGDSGFVIGPLLLGWIASGWGFGAGLLVNAGVSLAAALAFALLASGRRRGGQEDTVTARPNTPEE
jgi:MFS family permease